MAHTGITVKPRTLAEINRARIGLYTDADQVLNADGLILFLLAVWRYARSVAPDGQWRDSARNYLAEAGYGGDRRCHS